MHRTASHASRISLMRVTHQLFSFLPRLDVRGVSRIRQRRRRRRRLGDVVPVARHSGHTRLCHTPLRRSSSLVSSRMRSSAASSLALREPGSESEGSARTRASNASSVRRNASRSSSTTDPPKRSGRREMPLPVIGRKARGHRTEALPLPEGVGRGRDAGPSTRLAGRDARSPRGVRRVLRSEARGDYLKINDDETVRLLFLRFLSGTMASPRGGRGGRDHARVTFRSSVR